MNYREWKIRVRDLNDLFPILMGWSPSGWGEEDLEKKRDWLKMFVLNRTLTNYEVR